MVGLAEKKVYRYPMHFRCFFAGASVFWLVLAVWCALDVNNPTSSLGIAAFFLAFEVPTVVIFWLSMSRIEIDPEGLTGFRLGLASRRLAWQEIRQIRERPSWSLLELQG